MVTQAGKGGHRYHKLYHESDSKSGGELKEREHYLGLDAVRWYVNEQGHVLSKKMASGTVKLSLGEEEYVAGLGRYELEGGAYTAPVFNQLILPNRAYTGGQLTVKTYVRVIKSDTLLSKLLKDMAKASVTMIAGAVGAATAAGPLALLLKAGTSFTSGIEDILKQGEKGVTIFDPGGLQVTLSSSDVKRRNTYLLVHRGAELDGKRLKLWKTAKGMTVSYKGKLLRDGAWILYRLRRENVYGYYRPWQREARKLRGKLKDLITDLENGLMSREEAIKALDPSKKSHPNLASGVIDVRKQIRSDYVFTEKEMNSKAESLVEQLNAARDALKVD
jgi:hypothetical protein